MDPMEPTVLTTSHEKCSSKCPHDHPSSPTTKRLVSSKDSSTNSSPHRSISSTSTTSTITMNLHPHHKNNIFVHVSTSRTPPSTTLMSDSSLQHLIDPQARHLPTEPLPPPESTSRLRSLQDTVTDAMFLPQAAPDSKNPSCLHNSPPTKARIIDLTMLPIRTEPSTPSSSRKDPRKKRARAHRSKSKSDPSEHHGKTSTNSSRRKKRTRNKEKANETKQVPDNLVGVRSQLCASKSKRHTIESRIQTIETKLDDIINIQHQTLAVTLDSNSSLATRSVTDPSPQLQSLSNLLINLYESVSHIEARLKHFHPSPSHNTLSDLSSDSDP